MQATFARVMGEHCTLCLACIPMLTAANTSWCATCCQALPAHLLQLLSLQHDTGKDLLRLCCQQLPEFVLQQVLYLAAARRVLVTLHNQSALCPGNRLL